MEAEEFLNKVINIEAATIDSHFMSVPAELAYYNAQYADASERFLKAKMQVERSHAKAYKKCLHELERMGKKATVAAVESEIQLDLTYQCAREEHIDAETDKIRAKGLVETVQAKKDMLISLGAHIRSEMDYDPTIKQETAEIKEIRSKGIY